MELRHLRYFIVVAEELSIARAAARIHIEPSPLSRAIKELEHKLGVQLFERDKNRMRLTWAGEVFREEAARVLRAIEYARNSVSSAAKGYRGHLRIGISDGLAQPRLTEFFARCREEEPEVDVRISELTVNQLLSALQHDQIDAGFSLHASDDKGYCKVPVWVDNLAIAIPARHPLLSESTISLLDAARYPLIICHPELCSGGHTLFIEWFSEVKPSPTIAEYVSGHEPMMMLVAAGYGVGLAIESQIALYGRNDVVVRPVDRDAPKITTYILHQNKSLAPQLSQFIERAKSVGKSE